MHATQGFFANAFGGHGDAHSKRIFFSAFLTNSLTAIDVTRAVLAFGGAEGAGQIVGLVAVHANIHQDTSVAAGILDRGGVDRFAVEVIVVFIHDDVRAHILRREGYNGARINLDVHGIGGHAALKRRAFAGGQEQGEEEQTIYSPETPHR